MRSSIQIMLVAVCAAGLTVVSVTDGAAGGGGGHGRSGGSPPPPSRGSGAHFGGQSAHFPHGGTSAGTFGNTGGAAPRPKNVAQPKPPVVRDHGDRLQPSPAKTTEVCTNHGPRPRCTTVHDHRTGDHGHWRPSGHGPAGGPNDRNPHD